MEKKIVYIDMDDTIFDFIGYWIKVKEKFPDLEYPQSLNGFFSSLEPLPNAIESVNYLRSRPELDVFILTAPSVVNHPPLKEWACKSSYPNGAFFETGLTRLSACNFGCIHYVR